MKNDRTKPGVMIYFDDMKPAMRSLDDAHFGALMRGVIEFAEAGALPELDGIGQIIFDMIRPKIERDAEKYELTVWKRKYAVYVRETEKSEEQAVPFDEWFAARV